MREKEKTTGTPMCCDHCSDTKFPCAYIDRRMKTGKVKEPERKGTAGTPDDGGEND